MAFSDYSYPNLPSSASVSFGTLTTANAKTGSGLLKSAVATNANAAIRYLQFFNAVTATGTPIFSFPIPAGTANDPGSVILDSVFFGINGYLFLTGISWGISTTAGSYVAATASDHVVNITYV